MTPNDPSPSRRDFLATGAAAGTLAAAAALPVHAGGSDTLRVGLVGCGGRGTGAAEKALKADPGAKLVAIADAFPNRMTKCLDQMKRDCRSPSTTRGRAGRASIRRPRRLQERHRQLRRRLALHAARLPADAIAPPSRPASTSSARSRWPSTPPASAPSSSRPGSPATRASASSPASATDTKPRSATRSSAFTTVRSETCWPSTATTTPATSAAPSPKSPLFIVYATWAAFQGEHYWVPGTNYLSPFYSPELLRQRRRTRGSARSRRGGRAGCRTRRRS